MASIKAISISDRKGVRKKNIDRVRLVTGFGLEADAHGGKWHRQVSLLADESISKMRAKGLDVVPGNFAENITTSGIDLTALEVGRRFTIAGAELVVSQLGKTCHTRCAIYHQAGDCVMPREGIFAVVLSPAEIKIGDPILLDESILGSAAIVGLDKGLTGMEDALCRAAEKNFTPSFIRIEPIKPRSNTLAAVVNDLTKVQRIRDIILFDPGGELALNLTSQALLQGAKSWQENHSTIHYIRDIEDLSSRQG